VRTIYLAVASGQIAKGVPETGLVCAGRIVDDESGATEDLMPQSSGPLGMGYGGAGEYVLSCVLDAIGKLGGLPQNVAVRFLIADLEQPKYSSYVPDGMNKNIGGWLRNGGRTERGGAVPSWELWKKIAAFHNSRAIAPEWKVMERNQDEHAIYVGNLARMISRL